MFRIIFSLLVSLFITVASAQTGAGGVGNAASQPMWFDVNSMLLANGSAIAQMDDISGNGNHLTQSSSSRRPIYTTSTLNGLPVMVFDGVNDYLTRGATTGLDGTQLTWFMVYQRAANQSQSLINAGYTSEISKWGSYANIGSNSLISIHRLPAKSVSLSDPGGSPTFFSSHITATNFRTYKQGTLAQNLNTAYTAGVGHNLIRVGAYNYNLTNYFLNGYIAEIIVYSTILSDFQRIMVENYLGAKYNLAIPTDRYAYQATHNIGLVGIGNDGSTSQSTARGAGVMELNTPSSLSTGEYLLVAHTNDDLSTFTTSGVPASLPTHQRWLRTWKADETGDVGTTNVKFYLSGGNDFGSSSSYILLVDNVTQDGDFTDATQVTGTYSAGTVTFNTSINDGDHFTLCGIVETLEIHSIASGDWSDPNTWDCACTPTFDDQVYIDPSHNVDVDVDAETGYLSVDASASLNMTTNVTLNIYGEVDWAGSGTLTNGKLAFVGTGAQYITTLGNTLAINDFEVDKVTGTMEVIESLIELNGTFYPTRGSITIDPTLPNEFIINSTSSVTTGRIAPVGTSFTFNGQFGVRRFLPAGVADFRDICSPVNGATFTQWDSDIYIGGQGFPDGCAYGSGTGCYQSIQFYSINTAYDVTDINAPIVVGRGYEAFIGDNTTTFNGATLTVKGTLNDGQDVVVTASSYYSTRGNPYASPVLWPLTTRSGMGNYFYVYDPATGGYEYFDGSDNSSSIPELAGGIIGIGQGFWAVGPGTITFTDACKTTNDATFIRNQEQAPLTLLLKENSSTYSSNISFSEYTEASDDLDYLVDVTHLSTGLEKAPSVAMYSNSDLIRKNYIKADRMNKSFDIYTKILNNGYYTFEIQNLENFENYRKILLYDNSTGEFIDLKLEINYTFYSDIFEGHRFTLIFTNEEVMAESNVQSLTANLPESDSESMTITQMGNSFNVDVTESLNEDSQVKLVNILGQTEVYSSSVRFVQGSNFITVPAELKGVHILIITTGDKIMTKKVVL